MAKKLLAAILIPFLLSSCISITRYPDASGYQQDFVAATLAATATRWIPIASTVPPNTAIPSPAVNAAAGCTNGAILLQDVTIPDHTQVNAGETFTKTWEFQNTGTCPWIDYTLKFTSGDEINAPLSAPMPAAAPNEKVQVSMDLTAPTVDGTYVGYFVLLQFRGQYHSNWYGKDVLGEI